MMVGGAASSSTPVSSLRPVSDVLGPVFSLDMYRRTFSKRQNQQQQRRRRGGGQQRQRGGVGSVSMPVRLLAVAKSVRLDFNLDVARQKQQAIGATDGPLEWVMVLLRLSPSVQCGPAMAVVAPETAAAAGGIVAAVLEMVGVKPTPDSPKEMEARQLLTTLLPSAAATLSSPCSPSYPSPATSDDFDVFAPDSSKRFLLAVDQGLWRGDVRTYDDRGTLALQPMVTRAGQLGRVRVAAMRRPSGGGDQGTGRP